MSNRKCPYCKRIVPIDYNYNEHKKLCKRLMLYKENKDACDTIKELS